jgi:hypothetical protein
MYERCLHRSSPTSIVYTNFLGTKADLRMGDLRAHGKEKLTFKQDKSKSGELNFAHRLYQGMMLNEC